MNHLSNIVTIRQGTDYSSVSCISPAIGAFAQTTLRYDTCQEQASNSNCECDLLTPFSPATISFSFQPVMKLEAGDSIFLHLPGFTSLDLSDFRYPVISNPSKSMEYASWNQSSSRLTIIVTETMDVTGEVKLFELPISAGLRLPSNGTASASSLLEFEVNSKNGMVPPTSTEQSPYSQTIPSGSKINFNPNIPNQYMNVRFQFTPLAPITKGSSPCLENQVVFRPGDSVILRLPTMRT